MPPKSREIEERIAKAFKAIDKDPTSKGIPSSGETLSTLAGGVAHRHQV